MADQPWESEENRNLIYMHDITTNAISKGLRNVFKSEWDSRYQASLGAWDDTNASGVQLFHRENSRRRPNKNVYQAKFQHGDTNQWDCSVLFDAILYSNSIGSTLNPKIKTEVHKLRIMRNKIMHTDKSMLTDAEFQTMINDIENSFIALSLPIDDITCIKSKRNLFKSFKVLPLKPTHEVFYCSEKINKIKQDLQELRNENEGKLTYFYISGNPGSGKSQLSRRLGEDLYNSVDSRANTAYVMTLNANDLDSLLHSYKEFCRRLNCNEDVVDSVINASKSEEEKIRELRAQIAMRIRNWKLWWIIVDNVEDLGSIYPLLPQMGDEIWNNGQIILTIQNTNSVLSNSSCTKHISLSGGMNEQECRQLLSSLSDTDADDSLLDEVADKLDHQPLAMAAAAVYVGQLKEKEFSWCGYLEKLEKGKKRVTEKRLHETNSAYSSTMSAAVLLAVQKSAENDFILNETFHLFALISFEPLPIDVIVEYIQQKNQKCGKEEIYLAIKHCSLFLFTESENDVRLHRVVHEATQLFKHRNENEIKYNFESEIVNESNRVQRVAKALYLFKDRDDKIKILPHLNESFFQESLLDPDDSILNNKEIADMYIFFGQILRANYQLELAKDYHEKAMEIYINVLGPNHINVATSYNNLGLVYKAMGELEQAKDYHETAMEIYINVLGPNHINVAQSYNNLGSVYQALGELQQAKDYCERAIEIYINVLGPNHINVAKSYYNLGSVYQALGELEHAKDYHQRANEIYMNVLGPNHINVAKSYNNLGSVCQALGELEHAKDYHQRANEIYMNVLGPNHINVAKSYNNLGSVYQALGELQQAKDYCQRAREIRKNALGSNHIEIATSYNNLGSVYQGMSLLIIEYDS